MTFRGILSLYFIVAFSAVTLSSPTLFANPLGEAELGSALVRQAAVALKSGAHIRTEAQVGALAAALAQGGAISEAELSGLLLGLRENRAVLSRQDVERFVVALPAETRSALVDLLDLPKNAASTHVTRHPIPVRLPLIESPTYFSLRLQSLVVVGNPPHRVTALEAARAQLRLIALQLGRIRTTLNRPGLVLDRTSSERVCAHLDLIQRGYLADPDFAATLARGRDISISVHKGSLAVAGEGERALDEIRALHEQTRPMLPKVTVRPPEPGERIFVPTSGHLTALAKRVHELPIDSVVWPESASQRERRSGIETLVELLTFFNHELLARASNRSFMGTQTAAILETIYAEALEHALLAAAALINRADGELFLDEMGYLLNLSRIWEFRIRSAGVDLPTDSHAPYLSSPPFLFIRMIHRPATTGYVELALELRRVWTRFHAWRDGVWPEPDEFAAALTAGPDGPRYVRH